MIYKLIQHSWCRAFVMNMAAEMCTLVWNCTKYMRHLMTWPGKLYQLRYSKRGISLSIYLDPNSDEILLLWD